MPSPDNRGSKVYEAAGDRTQDLRIKSPLLYQLSYRLNNNPVKGNTVKKKTVQMAIRAGN